MALGYHGKLYILAFDHRGSFQKDMFGIEGEPTPEQTEMIADTKHLIYEGVTDAIARGAEAEATGVLVDEHYGSDVPMLARQAGLKLAMPVEKSGEKEFHFEYGEDFAAHVETFDPDFCKVLVRFNPEDPDADMNARQIERLGRLSDWLRDNERRFLFELLVAATDAQLASVGGDADRYDEELRPGLMRGAIAALQDGGVEVDVWKLEGVTERSDAKRLVDQARSGPGRDGVTCVLLGRHASTATLDQWLQTAAGIDGFIGFAIGRSIWWDPLKGFLAGDLPREVAAEEIGRNYLHFVDVYERAAVA